MGMKQIRRHINDAAAQLRLALAELDKIVGDDDTPAPRPAAGPDASPEVSTKRRRRRRKAQIREGTFTQRVYEAVASSTDGLTSKDVVKVTGVTLERASAVLSALFASRRIRRTQIASAPITYRWHL